MKKRAACQGGEMLPTCSFLKNINVKTKQIFKDIGIFESYILSSNKKELFFWQNSFCFYNYIFKNVNFVNKNLLETLPSPKYFFHHL